MKNVKIFKNSDIDKVYTSIVAKYISMGYTINTRCMSGSQGEIAKIDLVKDDEYIRILVDFNYIPTWDRRNKKIIVGRVPENERKGNATIWNQDLEVIESVEFYELSKAYDGNSTYTDNEEYAINAYEKAESRCDYTPINVEVTSIRLIAVIAKLIRNNPGFKRIKIEDISKVTRRGNKFTAICKGKEFVFKISK